MKSGILRIFPRLTMCGPRENCQPNGDGVMRDNASIMFDKAQTKRDTMQDY